MAEVCCRCSISWKDRESPDASLRRFVAQRCLRKSREAYRSNFERCIEFVYVFHAPHLCEFRDNLLISKRLPQIVRNKAETVGCGNYRSAILAIAYGNILASHTHFAFCSCPDRL